ncbi:unnamed protein product, partial [Rotaria magnacalcarata]
TPIRDKQQQSTIIRTLPSNERIDRAYDQSGYISDGPSHKYSIYKKFSGTNLDKNKSSSAKGLKSIFGRIIRTNSGNFREDHDSQTQTSFHRGGLRATTTSGKTSIKPLSIVNLCKHILHCLLDYIFRLSHMRLRTTERTISSHRIFSHRKLLDG